MAITKTKKNKFEMTPQAMIELGLAAGLVIVSFVLLFLGVNRWLLKRSIVKALELHDQNNPGLVADECRSAIRKNEKYFLARQLLAKVLVDEAGRDAAKLNEAEKEYQDLIAAGYDKPNAHLGLGVIHLLRADAASDAKQVADHAGKARAAFEAARKMDPSCLEAEIGLAHSKLIVVVKNGGDLAEVRASFEKIRAKVEKQGTVITKECLIDLYAGLARSMSGSGSYNEASRCYRICFLHAGGWDLPLLNLAYTDAERFATEKLTKEQLEQDKTAANFTQQLQNLALKSDLMKEAHAMRELALAVAYGGADHVAEMESRLQRLESAFPGRADVMYIKAWIWLDLARQKEPTEPGAKGRLLYVSKAADALKGVLELPQYKEADKAAERVILLNAAAVMLAETAYESRSDAQLHEAERFLRSAIQLDSAGSNAFVLQRNLAVVLKRIRSYPLRNHTLDQLNKDIEAAIAEAQKAAGSDGDLQRDLVRVRDWNP